jgi:pimeloyl-ACP methyl ester carboxylesterase
MSLDPTGADTLLLVPGLMCDAAVWQLVLPALSSGRTCQVVDHGDADALDQMARQLLHAAPPRFALAGHSMGARVALEVLRQAPERVSRVALLDTGYLARSTGAAGEEETRKRLALLEVACQQGVRAMAMQWVRGMVHPQRLKDTVLLEAIVTMFERKTAETFARQLRALLQRPDASGVLRTIHVPALVMCGRQDTWAPVTQHEAMCALIPGAQQKVVEDAGHMAPMEQPQAVAAMLLHWLNLQPIQSP